MAMDFNADRAHPCEQILFEHCYGYPLGGEFIRIDYCYDIPRILHCHVNPSNQRFIKGGYSRAVIDAVVAREDVHLRHQSHRQRRADGSVHLRRVWRRVSRPGDLRPADQFQSRLRDGRHSQAGRRHLQPELANRPGLDHRQHRPERGRRASRSSSKARATPRWPTSRPSPAATAR